MISRRLSVLAIAFAVLVSLAGAHTDAAVITWSGAALAGDNTASTISTLGTLVEAHNVGVGSSITVGGINFDSSDTNTLGNVFVGFNPANITGDTNFDSLLDSGSWGSSGTANYLIDGLINGKSYLAQFFVADSRQGLTNRTVTYSDGTNSLTSGPLGSGYVFTATFTAIGTTQNVVIKGSDLPNGNYPYMNAWQLRDVTPASATVPEPATLCIWAGLGLIAAGGAYRRRKASAA